MARKNTTVLCPDGCGHLWSEHRCSYQRINTSREYYECDHCRCKVHGDNVPAPVGLIRINGVWDYAENAHKYLGLF